MRGVGSSEERKRRLSGEPEAGQGTVPGALVEAWPSLRGGGDPQQAERTWGEAVRDQLASVQQLEAERRTLERRRAEIDREIHGAYRDVARMLRVVAVAGGAIPDPGGAHRGSIETTKTAQVLAALPGTQAQVAERTGIKPTVVATLLGRLQRDGGPVRKVGTEAVPGAPKRRHTVYDIDVANAGAHAGALWALGQRGGTS